MPLSFVQYTGDGVTDTFNIPFGYISKTDIQVRVDGVLDNGITFPTSATVKTSTIPASGAIVDVRRVTPNTSRLVDFEDGSLLSEEDLDQSALQTFYVMQEVFDDLTNRLALNSTNVWDALNKRITNVADGVDPGDVVNVNQTVSIVSDAQAAKTAAEAAQAAAETAETNAETARNDAIQAKNDAETAAASINMPDPAGNGLSFPRQKVTEDGFEYRTPIQIRSDLGLGTLATLNAVGAAQIDDGSVGTDELADGSVTAAKLAGGGLPFPKGYMAGPAVTYTNAATVTIPSGFRCRDAVDSVNIEFGLETAVDITVSGANGLDTGSEASATWYHLYAISNDDGSQVAGLLSVTNEAATGSITLPSGYTKKRQLPIAVKNDGSSNFRPFRVGDGWPTRPYIAYTETQAGSVYRVLNGGTASAFADVDLSGFVPPISRQCGLDFEFNASGAGDSWIREKGTSLTVGRIVGSSSTGYVQANFVDKVLTSAAQFIEYKTQSSVTIYVNGFYVTEVN